MTFVETALDVRSFLKTLSPEQKRERRRWQVRAAQQRYAYTTHGSTKRYLWRIRARIAEGQTRLAALDAELSALGYGDLLAECDARVDALNASPPSELD